MTSMGAAGGGAVRLWVAGLTFRPSLVGALGWMAGAGAVLVAHTLLIVRGVRAMRNLQSYGWALTGCALAGVTTLGAIPTLWAMAILLREDVRSEFGKTRRL